MPTTIGEALDAFLAHLELRHFAKGTRSGYRTDVEKACLRPDRREEPLASVWTAIHLAHTLRAQSAAGLQARSLRRTISTWRSFGRFCVSRGWLEQDPAAGIQRPRARGRAPKHLDESAITTALDELRTAPGAERDRALIEVLYSTGLRLSELVGLDVDDVKRSEQLVHVRHGKGGRERLVPIGQPALAAIDAYRATLEGEPVSLFVGHGSRRISGRTVQRAVKARLGHLADRAGVSPHWLRHSFATHLLERGAPLHAIKDLLGHASAETTEVYTFVSRKLMRRAHERAHPRG